MKDFLKKIPDLQDFLKYSRKCGISGRTLRYAGFSEIHTDMQDFLEYLQILRTFWNTYRYAGLSEILTDMQDLQRILSPEQ